MGNCNCFIESSSKSKSIKDSDILVEDLNQDNVKSIKSSGENLESNLNYFCTDKNSNFNLNSQKSVHRGKQNPTQNNLQKNQIKWNYISSGVELEENLRIEKEKNNNSNNQDIKKIEQPLSSATNSNILGKKKLKNPNNKTLSEVMVIKNFDKEFHRRKDCINVVFLGEKCVGKSSIVYQYINNKFEPYYIQTMFKECFRKIISYENKKINLNIIVTSGVEQYQEDYSEIYDNCDFFIVCCDLTSNESYLKAKEIISKDLVPYLFLYNKNNSNIILIGNKSDLKEKNIDMKNLIEYTNKYKIKFIESSAKNNHNIASTFNGIVELYEETLQN